MSVFLPSSWSEAGSPAQRKLGEEVNNEVKVWFWSSHLEVLNVCENSKIYFKSQKSTMH